MNVVITGASRGLGRSMAERFAEGGHNLVLVSRNGQALDNAVRELKQQYPAIFIYSKPFDLSVAENARACGNWVRSLEMELDILINNAGTFLPGSVHNEPEGTLETMIGVNLYSAYHLTRTLLPSMMEQRRGHIFNICSIASLKAYENGGAYSISKYALAGFSANLREELKPYGIKVTSVYPGAAYTDSWIGSGIDPKRIMEASDIADMVYAAARLSLQACVESIILRPQLGDL